MDKVKILCVGIGGYANVYLESLLKNENPTYEIVGLVDVYPDGCHYLKELEGIPLYSDIEDFYKENKADLCIITTPIYLHTRQILCALKNGSDVMCEKPLSGVSTDEKLIEEQAKKSGKFVIIGYQWSYSDAINSLKSDIQKGLYGKPEFLKSMVLWPRPKEYFTRGSGWAGKLKANDGTVMNDSVANNATAHYLHNMLYVTGAEYGLSSEVISLKADLIRVNNIENFDTAVIKFKTDNGADGLFVASHSTKELHNPIFEYRFSNGTVSYNDDDKTIIGKLNDGTVKEYGNPFENTNKKIYDAINSCGKKDYIPPCGVKAAAAHVRCIEKIQENPIKNVNKAYIKENGTFLFVEGLDELMFKCYNEEKLPSEYKDFEKLVDC